MGKKFEVKNYPHISAAIATSDAYFYKCYIYELNNEAFIFRELSWVVSSCTPLTAIDETDCKHNKTSLPLERRQISHEPIGCSNFETNCSFQKVDKETHPSE